jgi:hypothetical protein
VAIDPDIVLSRVARKERWPVEIWHGGKPSAERPTAKAVSQ